MEAEFSLPLSDLKSLAERELPAEPMAALVALAKTGDPAAFERLLLEHEQMVLNTTYKLLGNLDDARDAAQEVFLRFHRSLRRFDERRPLAPWLYRIAINVCRKASRKRTRLREIPIESQVSDLGHPSATGNVQENAEKNQQRRLLAELLETLSSREREALVLRDIEGLDTSQVAEILNIREVTVRSSLCSARNKLRLALGRRLRRSR